MPNDNKVSIASEAITTTDSVINYINFQFLANADILREQLRESDKFDDSDVKLFNAMIKEPFKKQIGRLRKIKRFLILLSDEIASNNNVNVSNDKKTKTVSQEQE